MIIYIQVLNCLNMHFLSIHTEFKIFVLYLHFGLYAFWTLSTVYCLKKNNIMLLKSGPPVHSLRTTSFNGPNSVSAYLPA